MSPGHTSGLGAEALHPCAFCPGWPRSSSSSSSYSGSGSGSQRSQTSTIPGSHADEASLSANGNAWLPPNRQSGGTDRRRGLLLPAVTLAPERGQFVMADKLCSSSRASGARMAASSGRLGCTAEDCGSVRERQPFPGTSPGARRARHCFDQWTPTCSV
jgi:hypothetical protein